MEEVNQLEVATIKKLGVLSVANISGLINFFIGLIFGILFFLMSFFTSTTSLFGFGLPSVLLMIIFPVFYGVMGFIGGALGASLYNLSAKIAKGVKLYS